LLITFNWYYEVIFGGFVALNYYFRRFNYGLSVPLVPNCFCISRFDFIYGYFTAFGVGKAICGEFAARLDFGPLVRASHDAKEGKGVIQEKRLFG
jgi:hypothetical protein